MPVTYSQLPIPYSHSFTIVILLSIIFVISIMASFNLTPEELARFHAYIQQGGSLPPSAPNLTPNPLPSAFQPTQVPLSAPSSTQPFFQICNQLQVRFRVRPSLQRSSLSRSLPLLLRLQQPNHFFCNQLRVRLQVSLLLLASSTKIFGHTRSAILQLLQPLAQAQLSTPSSEVQVSAFLQHMLIRLVWLQPYQVFHETPASPEEAEEDLLSIHQHYHRPERFPSITACLRMHQETTL